MPKAAWHQGVEFHTVSLGNQVTSKSIESSPLHAGPCKGRPNTSLTTRRIIIESEKLNKSFCQELFWGELDVTKKPRLKKSQSRQYNILMQNAQNERKVTDRMFLILKGMESFSQEKKNMFFPMKDGIAEALTEVEGLRNISHIRKIYLESFEYFLGLGVAMDKRKETEVRKVKDSCQTQAELAESLGMTQ